MKLRVIWVGKTKENYIKEGINKYKKLISPLCKLECIEIKESKEKHKERSLKKEGERILRTSPGFVLLHERGKEMSSVKFSEFLRKSGGGDFVIGGAYGVSEEVAKKASGTISLSKMTFTHDMARIIFMEQIYRALTILNKRGYHH
jgi:23S rRNA (pseudouridine1915-N3)-methyltransferase